MSNTYKNFAAVLVTLALVAATLAAFPISRAQAASCDFSRNLDVGVDGEDVRCLQRYLNGAGFTIAATGPGAPGGETSLFRELTRQAVARWQAANGLSPASGFFGPLSRAKYAALQGGGSPSVPTTPTSGNLSETQARLALLQAIAAMKDALDDGANIDNATDTLLDAFYAFLNGSYSQASSLARNAELDAEDSFDNDDDDEDEDDRDRYDEDDAQDAIEDAQDAIEDAWDALDNSPASGLDQRDAEDLIEEAEDLLADAEDAFDDEDWDEAVEFAEEAEDLANDAEDIANDDASSDEDEAEEALDDAEDAIEDARDDLADSNLSASDYRDADELLDEADDLFDEAQDAFDDDDWDDVIELTDEIFDLVDEAEDIIG